MADETGTTSTDAEVAAALGVDQVEDEQDEQEVDEDQESEEVGAELEKLRKENATLRREAAERRVREKQAAAKAKSTEGASDIEAAKEAGREEARAEHGVELATEAIRAALTGIIPDDDLDEFVDELNISRFVTDEHKPDRDLIASLKARQSKLVGGRKTTKVSHGRNGSGGSKSTQQQFEETFGALLK